MKTLFEQQGTQCETQGNYKLPFGCDVKIITQEIIPIGYIIAQTSLNIPEEVYLMRFGF